MVENKTLTRACLIESLHQHIGLSRGEASNILESFFEEITESLAQEQEVKLSSFGKFLSLKKKDRVGRNPKTGEVVPITARNSISFRASDTLKQKVDASNKQHKG